MVDYNYPFQSYLAHQAAKMDQTGAQGIQQK
jgi:hypothetical protein